jgi:hypothetical protein
MDERYPVAADRAPASQLALDFEVRLDRPLMIQELGPGERFLLESCGVEGRVVTRGPSSILVAIRGADDHWTHARWSLQTEVRRLQA